MIRKNLNFPVHGFYSTDPKDGQQKIWGSTFQVRINDEQRYVLGNLSGNHKWFCLFENV